MAISLRSVSVVSNVHSVLLVRVRARQPELVGNLGISRHESHVWRSVVAHGHGEALLMHRYVPRPKPPVRDKPARPSSITSGSRHVAAHRPGRLSSRPQNG